MTAPPLDLRQLSATLTPLGAARDRDAAFPYEAMGLLQDAGLLGLTVNSAFGGAEAPLSRCLDLVEAVAIGCPATALIFAMQLIQHRGIANGRWPAALQERVGRDAVERGALINALRVEPGLGTPARGGLPETTARRVADGWSLTGRKIYSTGSPGLTWFMVFARTDEAEPRMGMILVPANAPGVSIEETWDHLGLRASGSHDVVFEDVFVPDEYLADMRRPKEWGAKDPDQAVWNTMMVAALYTGVAIAARDWTVEFLKNRVPTNLGASLATLPRMQEAMGAVQALITTNRRLYTSAATEADAGNPPSTPECNLIKATAAENAISAVQQMVALAGNHALARSNPLERHLRDVLCARIHTPQADAAHTAAGRALFGL